MIVRRGDDFTALDRTPKVSRFLRTFIHEQDHSVNVRMICENGIGDVMQQGRLACARRGDNQAARAFADGRDEVYHARGNAIGHSFEDIPLVRIDTGQIIELLHRLPLFRRVPINLEDLGQLGAAFFGWHRPAFDLEAGLEAEFSDHVRRHVNIVRADLEALGGIAQEAKPFLADFEDAADLASGWLLRWRLCLWLLLLLLLFCFFHSACSCRVERRRMVFVVRSWTALM